MHYTSGSFVVIVSLILIPLTDTIVAMNIAVRVPRVSAQVEKWLLQQDLLRWTDAYILSLSLIESFTVMSMYNAVCGHSTFSRLARRACCSRLWHPMRGAL